MQPATVIAAVALAAPLGTAAVLALRRPTPPRPRPEQQPDRTAELFAIPRPDHTDTE